MSTRYPFHSSFFVSVTRRPDMGSLVDPAERFLAAANLVPKASDPDPDAYCPVVGPWPVTLQEGELQTSARNAACSGISAFPGQSVIAGLVPAEWFQGDEDLADPLTHPFARHFQDAEMPPGSSFDMLY